MQDRRPVTVQSGPFPLLICISLHKTTISQVDGRHLIRINSLSVHSKNILKSKGFFGGGFFLQILQQFSTGRSEDVQAAALFSAS